MGFLELLRRAKEMRGWWSWGRDGGGGRCYKSQVTFHINLINKKNKFV